MYILKRPEQAISDYHIKSKIEDILAKVELDVKFYSPTNVKISIEDKNGAVVALGSIDEEGTFTCERAMEIGRATAMVLGAGHDRRKTFVIGKDTRLSSVASGSL